MNLKNSIQFDGYDYHCIYISTNFMHQSCLFELLGSYIKNPMYLRFEIKKKYSKLMIKFVLPSF
jgi:hypothetical protein